MTVVESTVISHLDYCNCLLPVSALISQQFLPHTAARNSSLKCKLGHVTPLPKLCSGFPGHLEKKNPNSEARPIRSSKEWSFPPLVTWTSKPASWHMMCHHPSLLAGPRTGRVRTPARESLSFLCLLDGSITLPTAHFSTVPLSSRSPP